MPEPLLYLLLAGASVALSYVLFWPGIGLVHKWRREGRMTERVLSEDTLKHLSKNELLGRIPTLESIAGVLQVSTSRAAEILERLDSRGLVEIKGEQYPLTGEGRRYGINIIRAHRLWERYLAEETGYTELEWHDLADQQEHDLSPDDAERLAARLGNPKYDPHGDPIPSSQRGLRSHAGVPLTSIEEPCPIRIVHVEDEPDAVYAQLVALGLRSGMTAMITEVSPDRVRIWADGEEHVLASIVAANLSVVPLESEEQLEPSSDKKLSSLNPGEEAEVVGISRACLGPELRRLMDLGVLPGTVIRAEMASPSGGLTAYRIRGAMIALRNSQADRIQIKERRKAAS